MSEVVAVAPWAWAVFTLAAAAAQTARNAMQRGLTGSLGTVGATHVRFLFGLPFAACALAAVVFATGASMPSLSGVFGGWLLLGALSQIVATALMLAAMQARAFVVAVAYTKTEPIQVAVFGIAFLGEIPTAIGAAAILVATLGVMMMSWPPREGSAAARGDWRPAMLGIAAGGGFALSAVGYRAAILSLDRAGPFVLNASTTLVCGLVVQTTLLSAWLLWRDRPVALEIFRHWRPSVLAGFMGALASQFWFLAFAIEPAAHVRTLGLAEILFAMVVSRRLFNQSMRPREWIGTALVCAAVVVLALGFG